MIWGVRFDVLSLTRSHWLVLERTTMIMSSFIIKRYLWIFGILLLSSATLINGAWFQSRIPVSSYDFVSATFSSPTVCVMVGYNANGGSIIRSKDSGVSWTIVSTPFSLTQTSDIAQIAILSKIYYLVVSKTGLIYLSSDNGVTYNATTTITGSNQVTGASLNGVDIGSNFFAYAVGVANSPFVSKIYSSNSTSLYKKWKDITPSFATAVRLELCVYRNKAIGLTSLFHGPYSDRNLSLSAMICWNLI